jgi:alpha-soluble NSF attachment protein
VVNKGCVHGLFEFRNHPDKIDALLKCPHPKNVDRPISQTGSEKLKGSSWFWSSPEYDEAAELFTRAAHQCLAQKLHTKAIELYRRAAECYVKDNDLHRAIESYHRILPLYKICDNSQEAIPIVETITTLAVSKGLWNYVAKAHEIMAQLYHRDGLSRQAYGEYQKAIDYYMHDNNTACKRRCRLEMATISLQLEDYPETIQIYQDLRQECFGERVLHYHILKYTLMMGLCHLAHQDVVAAKRCLDEARGELGQFGGSSEDMLLDGIIGALEFQDLDRFTQTIATWNRLHHLENPVAVLLLKIRSMIEPAKDESKPIDLT